MKPIEMQRSNITPKVFYNTCKKALENKGFDWWFDYYDEWANPEPIINDRDSNEIYRSEPFYFQSFYKNEHNFNMEFDFDDDKKGYGYFYFWQV